MDERLVRAFVTVRGVPPLIAGVVAELRHRPPDELRVAAAVGPLNGPGSLQMEAPDDDWDG
jgi:hypothetical protein